MDNRFPLPGFEPAPSHPLPGLNPAGSQLQRLIDTDRFVTVNLRREGGKYRACAIPRTGKLWFNGWGETPEAAIADLAQRVG